MILDLTGRQQSILLAIVLDYIATAEPVGSRTISRKYDLALSPATIRNDMSELEEKGFLVQPHSSAGRIPSEMGYRNFVNYLMQKDFLSDEDVNKIKAIREVNTSNLEFIMEQSAKVLSAMSNSVTILQLPDTNNELVKHFQLLPINDTFFIIVLVSNTGRVTDYRIKLDEPVDDVFFTYITNYFNEQLVGTPISQLHNNIKSILYNNGKYDNLVKKMCENLSNDSNYNKNKLKFTGTSNLLKIPEFTDKDRAHDLIDFFENDEQSVELLNVIDDLFSSKNENSIGEVKVLIGNEIRIEQLKNCSIIVSPYKIGDSISGSIGLLGPTRMHYGRAIAAIEEMTKNLSDLLTNIWGISSNNLDSNKEHNR